MGRKEMKKEIEKGNEKGNAEIVLALTLHLFLASIAEVRFAFPGIERPNDAFY